MTSAQPKNTDETFDRFLALADHINADNRATANVMLAPAAADFESLHPAALAVAPDRELTPDETARLCILADEIAAVAEDVAVLIFEKDGQPHLIASPPAIRKEPDAALATLIVGSVVGASAPAETPERKWPSWIPKTFSDPPKAANDNAPPPHDADAAKPRYHLQSAADLLTKEFPPVKFVVPGLIPEGLTILGGRPKLGKSWLAANVCLAVATGGAVLGQECEQGDALYLALEDNERRLKDRFGKLLPPIKSLRPDISRLAYMTEAPRMNAGLIQALDMWRTTIEDPRLIVIDTLAMVRPPKGRNQGDYEADYAALSPLQLYASEHRVGIIVVTHVRKAEAADPLEMISGTNGLTGAGDTVMVLNRDSDGAKLYGRGRDCEEYEKALRFEAGRWSVLGDADDVKRSDQRRKILSAFEESQAAMSPKDISEATGMSAPNVKYLLGKMVAGELEKLSYGAYRPAAAA